MYRITLQSNATVSEYDAVRRVSCKRLASLTKGGDMAMRGAAGIGPCSGAGGSDRGVHASAVLSSVSVAATVSRARPLALSCKMSNSVYKYYTNVLGCWFWLAAAIECRRLASIAEPQRLPAAHTLSL